MESISRDVEAFYFTPGEERANIITHGIGVVASVAAAGSLITLAVFYGDVWRVVSFSIYGTSLVLMYLISTLYHALRSPKAKHVLRILDHISIYLLIAGTYTPFMLVNMRGDWGWPILGVIWGLAATGIIFKIFMTGRWDVVSSIMYILMGWIVLIAFKPFVNAVPLNGILWLAAGGCAYTGGVAFYSYTQLPYHHAIWHCFVLLGSICHFCAILFYVLPME